jgi:hypothetical protein
MPTPPAEEPLRRITINIFESDYVWYKRNYGDGYQVQIRELVRNWRDTVATRQGRRNWSDPL